MQTVLAIGISLGLQGGRPLGSLDEPSSVHERVNRKLWPTTQIRPMLCGSPIELSVSRGTIPFFVNRYSCDRKKIRITQFRSIIPFVGLVENETGVSCSSYCYFSENILASLAQKWKHSDYLCLLQTIRPLFHIPASYFSLPLSSRFDDLHSVF